MVATMVATVEELLNVPPGDPLAERRVLDVAERQLRVIVLGMGQWREPDGERTATDDALTAGGSSH